MSINNVVGKTLLLGLFLIFALTTWLAAGPDVTFYAGFNNKSAVADKANGNPAPLPTKKEFQFVPGVSGQAVLVTPETPLSYEAQDNINPVQGSISFWIQPQNWDKATPNLYPLYWLGEEGSSRIHYYFYYYDGVGSDPTINFRSRLTPGKSDGENVIQEYVFAQKAEVFSKDKWTYIVCTWSNWEFSLYINGEKAGDFNFSLPVEIPPLFAKERIWLAVTQFWGQDYKFATAVDEVEIYNRMLTADEIKSKYSALKPRLVSELKPSVVPVPKSAVEVLLDGKIKAEEWADATKIPVNKIFQQSRFISVPAWCYLKYDQKNLYIAFEVPYNGKLDTPATGRSTQVFNGDEAEVILRTPTLQKSDFDPIYQFAVAPNGAFAARYGESSDKESFNWQSGFRHAASVDKNFWSAELAIPFSDLSPPLPNQPWLISVGLHRPTMETLGGESERWLSFSGGTNGTMFHEIKSMAKLIFQPDNTAFRVENIGDLDIGQIDLSLAAPGGTPVSAQVSLRHPTPPDIINQKIALEAKPKPITQRDTALGEGILRIDAFRSEETQPIFSYSALFYIKDPIVVKSTCHAETSELEVFIDTSGMNDYFLNKLKSKELKGIITLKSNKDNQEYGKSEFIPQSTQETVRMKFKELPVGTYTIRTEISAGPDNKVYKELLFERPDPYFLTAKIGIDQTVPAPWTPVEISANKIRIFGREYVFGDGPFPREIYSNGQKVLGQAPEIKIVVGGEEHGFVSATEKTIEAAPDKVITTGNSVVAAGGFSMNWRRTVEFDGLIRVDLDIIPQKRPGKIDELKFKMVIPMEAAQNLLMGTYQDNWKNSQECTASPGDSIFFTGYNNAGLEFFTVSDANWVYGDGQKPIRIYRDGPNAVIDCAIISSPVTFDKNLSYTFGIIATPTRPLPKNWRSVHVDGWGVKGQTLQSWFIYSSQQKIQWPNEAILTDMIDEKAGLEELSEWNKKGIDVIPYALTGAMPDCNPYYDFYGTLWETEVAGQGLAKSFRTDFPWLGEPFYLCCRVCAASGFGDFLAWSTDHFLSKYPFGGLYHDYAGRSSCDNPLHGCQVVDAFGRLAKTQNDFAIRETFKRLYKIVHKHRPNGYFWAHTGLDRAPHLQSFIDIQYMGEEFMHSAPANPNIYTDEKNALLNWQTNYNSSLTGVPVHIIAQANRAKEYPPKNPKLDRPIVTMCMLHDVRLGGDFIYPPTVEEAWRIMDDNNLTTATFVGYWLNHEIISETKDVLVSYYQWPGENKLLLVLGNITPAPLKTTLEFKNPFTEKKFTAIDQRTMKEVNLKEPIQVEDRDFRAITVSW